MPPVVIAAAAAAASYGATSAVAAGLLGAELAASSFAATAIGAVAGLVVSTAGSLLLAQGANKGSTAIQAADRQQVARSGVLPKNVIYGQSFVSGPIAFMASSGPDNEFLNLIIPLAAHPIDGIDFLLLNNYLIDINTAIVAGGGAGAGLIGKAFITIASGLSSSTGPVGITTVDTVAYPNYGVDPKAAYVQANLYDGTQLTADADLIAECPALWTSAHKLLGLPYVYLKIFFSQDVFSGGFSNVSALCRGKRLFDPRSSTTAYSNNFALAVLDYLQEDFGLGAPDAEIDAPFWIAAANLADEVVYTDVAMTMPQARYTLDGAFQLNQTPMQIMTQLLATACATLTYVQGKYRLYPAAYDAPTETINPSDFSGKVSLITKTALKDQFNTVTGTYIEPLQSWSAIAFPQVEDAAAVTEDGATISGSLDLPFIIDGHRAQRIAQLHLKLSRANQTRLTADFKFNLLRLAAWDTATVNLPAVGWSGQVTRCENWKYDPVTGAITAVLHTEASAAYTWTATDAAPPIIAPPVALVSPVNLPTPAISTAADYAVAADGTVVPDLLVAWTKPANPFVRTTEVQWKKSADATWNSLQVDMPVLQIPILPVLPDVSYDIRVRFIAGLVRGAFSATSTLNGAGKTTPPNNPTGGTLAAFSGGYLVSWTLPSHSTDPDVALVVIQEQVPPLSGTFVEVMRIFATQAVVLTPGSVDAREVVIGSADRSGNVATYTPLGIVTPLP